MLPILTLCTYLVAALIPFMELKGSWARHTKMFFMMSFTAVILHGFLLYHWIDVGAGQNLTVFNLFSLIAWLISLLILLTAFAKPVESLTIFVFPLAALSIILVVRFSGRYIIDTAADPKQLIHILLATAASSVLGMAGLQAILLAIQEHRLHNKTSRILQKLPPLETMETLLFQVIGFGFLLLTLLTTSSIYFFHSLLLQSWPKTVLAIIAWTIFAVLLIGRRFLGWRGRKAIYYTLSGVLVLVILYYQ